jgi:hypothetical protein
LVVPHVTGLEQHLAPHHRVARLDVEDVEELRVLFRKDLFALDEHLVDGLPVRVRVELEFAALQAPLNELLLWPRGLSLGRRREHHRHHEREARHPTGTLSRLRQTPTSR